MKKENNISSKAKIEQLDKKKLLKIAQECGCLCHQAKDRKHFVPCCDAVYKLIKDLEKND